jgi:uncharacterized protein YjbJ (UPF0337 family)
LRGETQPLSEALQFGTIVGGNAAVAASAKQVKVTVEQVVGKAAGDNKLESEGKAERIEDKVNNAIGGFKNTAQREIDDVLAPRETGPALSYCSLAEQTI